MNDIIIDITGNEQPTPFEKDLFRLAMVTDRFYHVYYEMPKASEKSKSSFSFKSLLREYAIIQLHNFLKIHDSLRHDLKKFDRESFIIALQPLWEPIYTHKEAIRLFRNKYLAHIQDKQDEQFNKRLEEILYETKFEGSWNDITFYAGCVLLYSNFFELNFVKEWWSAHAKYTLPMITTNPSVVFKRDDIKHVKDVDWDILEVLNKVTNNLKKISNLPSES